MFIQEEVDSINKHSIIKWPAIHTLFILVVLLFWKGWDERVTNFVVYWVSDILG